MSLTLLVVLAAVAVVVLSILGAVLAFRREDEAKAVLEESESSGLDQPASLHPVIDYDACIGSAACVDVCPEHVLGVVDGKTMLVKAGECIGHGRCHSSCPVNAIALVFGTAQRGVDIPLLRQGLESNKDGIFVAGELGGMGLIRNAMRQGLQAVETAKQALERPSVPEAVSGTLDVAIIGGGPAGVAAALRCVELGLSYVVLEQYALGGSVMHYPRRKLVFTETITLPKVGKFGKAEMLKEELVAEFERVVLEAGITVTEGRRVTAVTGAIGRFVIEAEAEGQIERHRARAVVLAIGRRGTPRKLEVPGEDLPHVVYRLQDAEQYRKRKVLVVGGGDSAIEAAVSLSQVAGTTVHLSYRGGAFYRVKKKNREQLDEAAETGRVALHLETNVSAIGAGWVTLVDAQKRTKKLAVDDVIINAGGVLPTPFLEAMGVRVETKRGEAVDMGDSSKVLVEKITNRITKVGAAGADFARASKRFVETASKRLTGRSSDQLDALATKAEPGAAKPAKAPDAEARTQRDGKPGKPDAGKPDAGKPDAGKPAAKAPPAAAKAPPAAAKAPPAKGPPGKTAAQLQRAMGRRPAATDSVDETTEDLKPWGSDDKLDPIPDEDDARPTQTGRVDPLVVDSQGELDALEGSSDEGRPPPAR